MAEGAGGRVPCSHSSPHSPFLGRGVGSRRYTFRSPGSDMLSPGSRMLDPGGRYTYRSSSSFAGALRYFYGFQGGRGLVDLYVGVRGKIHICGGAGGDTSECRRLNMR